MTNANIPWSRLAIEGVVIIGSILIAFAIDAWWEERLERQDERRYLTSLHQEFLQSLVSAKNAEQQRISVLAGNESLIKRFQEGAEQTTDESLYFDLSLLSMPVGFNPPRSVLDDLVSSGGTQLIRSDELRIALAQYSIAPGCKGRMQTQMVPGLSGSSGFSLFLKVVYLGSIVCAWAHLASPLAWMTRL